MIDSSQWCLVGKKIIKNMAFGFKCRNENEDLNFLLPHHIEWMYQRIITIPKNNNN